VGLKIDDASRAYPWETLVKQSPVVDHVHGTPLLVAVGPDGKSFRVFVSRIDGKDAEFFLKGEAEGETKTEAQTDTPTEQKTETEAEVRTDPLPATKPAAPAETKAVVSTNTKADVSAAAKPAPAAPLKPWILLDTTTASEWNFQGCAISGPAQGKCLDRVPALKDY